MAKNLKKIAVLVFVYSVVLTVMLVCFVLNGIYLGAVLMFLIGTCLGGFYFFVRLEAVFEEYKNSRK